MQYSQQSMAGAKRHYRSGQPMHPPQHIYGIDFSGAQDAGKKIWIPEGLVKTAEGG
ncbi:MAG: hypothetical protein JRF25_08835 [Deltaproteobacteria bacterium]|nr:hypothetical protein [Deltaproteobacteria bacterium]